MHRYRQGLPQLTGRLFLTDGGIETTLIFREGLELPHFAAFDLLKTGEGRAALERYYRGYLALARHLGAGLVLEGPTWRANPDWGARLGYGPTDLAAANRAAIDMLDTLRDDSPGMTVVVSGCIGPRGDGYVADRTMTPSEAAGYHQPQIDVFAESSADMVCALTLNYVEEAIGIAMAAQRAGMPAALSFTVETDGRLPTGRSLGEALEAVDSATERYPAYYMINCAHPSHLRSALSAGESWMDRIRGLRANASRMSHAELNEAAELDAGNPGELGREYAELKAELRQLVVLGGCCGTDERHIAEIAAACAPLFES